MLYFYLSCKVITLTAYLFAYIDDGVRCVSLFNFPRYDPSRKYDFPTYFPTNVDTETLQFVETRTPLTFDTAVLERALFKNTGKSVTVQIDQKTKDGIYGGVLYPDRYVFEKVRYYWTNRTDPGARAASTMDNIGSPLEIVFHYWNEKYCNFTNALNYRDGLVLADVPIDVGLVPNPGFIFTQQYLAQVKKAGTQVEVEFGSTYLFYGTATPTPYVAYPGSYTDENSGKTYFCATVITGFFRFQRPFISRAQFQGFLNLRNAAGGPLTNQAPLHRDPRVPKVYAIASIIVPQVG